VSHVIAAPEMLGAAAADLATIDSSLSAAHTAAASPTVALVSAAADEVSASIAHLFSQHAQGYQAVAGQAAAFHEQFIQYLNASARSYASTEAANTSSLRSLGASAGSHASANAEALPAVNVSFKEVRDLLFLFVVAPLALDWLLLRQLILLIPQIQQL
jgi:hypothetical protein